MRESQKTDRKVRHAWYKPNAREVSANTNSVQRVLDAWQLNEVYALSLNGMRRPLSGMLRNRRIPSPFLRPALVALTWMLSLENRAVRICLTYQSTLLYRFLCSGSGPNWLKLSTTELSDAGLAVGQVSDASQGKGTARTIHRE